MTADSRQEAIEARRARRNATVGWVLAGFAVLVFAVTVVKMSGGHQMEAFDHAVRPSLLEGGP